MRSRLIRSIPAIVSFFVIASCSDSGVYGIVAPRDSVPGQVAKAPPPGPTLNALVKEPRLELEPVAWGRDLRNPIRVSQAIDEAGGTISIPETGLTIFFPEGAVSAPVTITVTAHKKFVVYKMQPSGTQFLKDVIVTQSLAPTELGGRRLKHELLAAYIADDLIKIGGKKVRVQELEPSHTVYSPVSPLIPIAHVWIIRHFSRYMLASG